MPSTNLVELILSRHDAPVHMVRTVCLSQLHVPQLFPCPQLTNPGPQQGDKQRRTPLHVAAMSPNGADIVMLLLSCGARADARDTVEKTAEAYGQKHPDVRTAFR